MAKNRKNQTKDSAKNKANQCCNNAMDQAETSSTKNEKAEKNFR